MILDHVQVAAPPGCEALRARGGAWFALGGGGELHVGVEEPFTAARKAHPAFRLPAAEVDELAKRLEAAGARVEWDDSLPGVRRFYTADPWGNRLELLAAG